jgi:hypothetical protein
MMNKTFGVCIGLLALGLVGLGAPASRAESRLAAGETGGGSETATTSAASSSNSPTASSPADLRQRIDALKAELADLNKELAAEKDGDPATSAAAPQDQGAPPPATPAAAPAAAAAAPMPLPTPSMSAPLSTAIPHEISAGPFGKVQVTGILSGVGDVIGNRVNTLDSSAHADISNAQVFVQKTTGWFQFYLQGGAYNIPALGSSFAQDGPTISSLYGAIPEAYLKLAKGNFNIEVGSLPTLVGAEYTFSFENMNIERGMLWGQETAISRGVQLNETYKKLTLAFSVNDGYYSNRYTTLSGSLAYAINASNTLTFVGQGNAGSNVKNTVATPKLQNNSMIYNLIYMYAHGNWMIMPYYQYNVVKANPTIGILAGSHTNGGAILANYNFKHGFSFAVRPEYIRSSSGNLLDPNTNLLGFGSSGGAGSFGPGSGAFTFTATPAWAKDGFFVRADISVVHLTNLPASGGTAFGPTGTNANQPRGEIEAGFMF